MSKLQELIKELCPDGVEFRKLGEVCEVKTGSKPKLILENEDTYEYINAGTTNSGYTKEFNCEGDTITTPSRGQGGIGFIGYQKNKFWLGPLCYKISSVTSKVLNKYIYYALCSDKNAILKFKKEGGTPALNVADLNSIEIPLPPLEVQNEIVRILDTFTSHAAELQAELQTRKEQYEYYRNKLLSFDENDERVKWMKLGEVCIRVNKIKWHENQDCNYLYIDLSSVDIQTKRVITENWININNAPSRAQQIVKEGDILFGTTRPTLMRYSMVNSDFDNQICSTGFCVLRACKNIVINKWIYFMISSINFFNFVNINQKGAGYPSIPDKEVFNFVIPIPPLSEQQRIVSILEKFESLVNDLTAGLPAEISAVQEQYEYYRNKLLTFKRI